MIKKSDIFGTIDILSELVDIKDVDALVICELKGCPVAKSFMDAAIGMYVARFAEGNDLLNNSDSYVLPSNQKADEINYSTGTLNSLSGSLPEDKIIEALAYEYGADLNRVVISALRKMSKVVTLDMSPSNQNVGRFSTKKFERISNLIESMGPAVFVVSPDVNAALQSLKGNEEVDQSNKLLPTLIRNGSIILTDYFATDSYVMKVPEVLEIGYGELVCGLEQVDVDNPAHLTANQQIKVDADILEPVYKFEGINKYFSKVLP